MTNLLQKAFDQASRLSESEQDALARWMLEELASEKQWDKRFAQSEDTLSKLAAEALQEHQQDRTSPLDLDSLE